MEKFTFVTMPKAAVHEDDSPILGEYQIRASRQVTLMQSVAKSKSEQSLSYQTLRFGVLAPNAGHAVAALRW